MSSAVVIALVIAAVVVLGGGVVLTTARRTDVRGAGALARETRKKDKPVDPAVFQTTEEVKASTEIAKPVAVEVEPWVAPDAEAIGVSRRQFFNRASVTLMSASIGAFGAAVVGFLWKAQEGGFGSKIGVGKLSDVIQQIRANNGFLYLSEARAWVSEYPADALAKAKVVYANQGPVLAGMESGIVALYQKCPHLGCRVPECKSSQWFECPCHGSQYSRVGEKKGGPAPRGMDRFGVAVNNGNVVIDTGSIFAGPAIGVNTTGQEAEGPHCIGAGEGGH
jgi:cytochrome b6-f complex iron-sulfur subunit